MVNAMASSAAGQSERAHTLRIMWASLIWDPRPYWECSCFSARHLPAKKGGETKEAGLQRARESHARHQAKELSR